MAFFQNPFSIDFFGNWVLADRKQSLRFPNNKLTFRNEGRSDEIIVPWEEGPYNLAGVDASGNDASVLDVNFAIDCDLFKNWANISIDVAGAVPAATTAAEIVALLNADTDFASYFTAQLTDKFPSGTDRISIKQNFPATRMRYFVGNAGAETILRFNARAAVAEMPAYFARHTMANRNAFGDSQNMLIELDPTGWAVEGDTVAGDVIFHAVDKNGISENLDPTDPLADWEMLEGRSGLFIFKNNCLDDDDNIVQTIEYQAGATVGDMARKICYAFDGHANPIQITEEPYVLSAFDLVEPDCSECPNR